MQLWFVRCIAMYCGAADERGSFPQPSLGVSSLDLGRSETRTAPFYSRSGPAPAESAWRVRNCDVSFRQQDLKRRILRHILFGVRSVLHRFHSPPLGVSSLDLGRSETRTAFFSVGSSCPAATRQRRAVR